MTTFKNAQSQNTRPKVGIIGALGYTGLELIALLEHDARIHLHALASRSNAGKRLGDIEPRFAHSDYTLCDTADAALFECALVFFATPHAVAMHEVAPFLACGIKVIDLSADFRLPNPALYETWYGVAHPNEAALAQAVYGLTEYQPEAIARAQLVANPGCYPTLAMLSLLPLLKAGAIAPNGIVADMKSGVSGAGKTLRADLSFNAQYANFKAYAVAAHRHLPEMEYYLTQFAGHAVSLTFVPHLLPIVRGMQGTFYVKAHKSLTDCKAILQKAYDDARDICVVHESPHIGMVAGTNRTAIAIHEQGAHLVITAVFDNLQKGASGQAVQNMALMLGLPTNPYA